MMKGTLKVAAVGDREIVITRDFDAPRALVWEAMSRPDLLRRWLAGPPGWELTTCEEDHRVGGTFRWEWSAPDGAGLTMSGVYREFAPPECCVRTEAFAGKGLPPMGEQLATLVLTDRGEQTSLALTVLYPSREARDGALASGMEKGLGAGYKRLDEILGGDPCDLARMTPKLSSRERRGRMIETPQVVEAGEQLTASIPLVVPRDEIQRVMGPAIREVYAALSAQGIMLAGPWFTHHRRRPTDTFDFDVCVPVATPVQEAGRVKPGRRPAARVARTVYSGPSEGLSAAWGEFCAWIETNGLSPREDLWECYLVGPESSPDPSARRTELNRPLSA